MKTFKTIFTVIALTFVTGVTAQKINKQIVDETWTKNYEVTQNDKTFEYTVAVENMESNYVTMEREDLPKKEQDRVHVPANVTKIVRIDNDMDPMYDNVLKLTYKTEADEHFNITPTEDGFMISVVGQELRYNFLKRDYEVSITDANTFEVVVMESEKK